jgi:hypothetical protein
MSTPRSAVDGVRLFGGPFLTGTPDAADGELVRLALDARPRRLAQLRQRWHAARLRRLRVTLPMADGSTIEDLATMYKPIRAGVAKRTGRQIAPY